MNSGIKHEIYAKRPRISSREVEDETVIIDKYTGEIHQLNATASFIWDALDGSTSLTDIVQNYATNFNIEINQADLDVRAVIESLVNLGILNKVGE